MVIYLYTKEAEREKEYPFPPRKREENRRLKVFRVGRKGKVRFPRLRSE